MKKTIISLTMDGFNAASTIEALQDNDTSLTLGKAIYKMIQERQ